MLRNMLNVSPECLPPAAAGSVRIASWNIHKGVMGLGPLRSLRIHALSEAVHALQADVVCLQEVRHFNLREQRFFSNWPLVCQSQVLTPASYHSVYRTNAVTRYGEHGNALVTRYPVAAVSHQDISDHRLEQRGLLHVSLRLPHSGGTRPMHVLVLHLGLIPGSRVRQLMQVQRYVQQHIPDDEQLLIAGDFNTGKTARKWAVNIMGLQAPPHMAATFPARVPVVQLDHVFWRYGQLQALRVQQRRPWAGLSDHLPLVLDIAWEGAGGL